jgi:Family of unknown function (DUF6152)
MRLTVNLISLILVLACLPAAYGHHSTSAFDMQAPPVTLRGVVADVEWANPHIYLYIDTVGNSPERWALEGDAPSYTDRQCWKRDTVQPGDEVVVLASPPRDPNKKIGHLTVLEKDGRVLWDYRTAGEGGAPCTEAVISSRSDSLDGVWSLEPLDVVGAFALPPSEMPIYLRLLLGLLPLTDAAEQARAEFSDETMASLDCLPVTSPIALIGGGAISIDLGDDVVEIRENNEATTRTVYMNVESHEGVDESWLGHSIGHWDGTTLVIDTAQFAEHPEGNLVAPIALPSSNQRHLEERFSLADEGRTLVYSFLITDPVYLAEPVQGEHRFTYTPDFDFEPVPCSVENARKFLTD